MFPSIEDARKIARDNLEIATKSLSALSQGAEALAVDAADYARRSAEQSGAAMEKLAGAKSLDSAVEIQAAFAAAAYRGFVAHATRMGDVVTTLARESCKPFEGVLSRTSSR
jgi:hypothetical protein